MVIHPIHCIALYRCIAVSCCIVVSRVEALSPCVRKYTVCIECDTTDVSRCIAPYTVIHQICDTSKTIPPCSTFWSHEHAKHSPNASTNHTKTNDNARALKMFARGQLKVLQMAVSAPWISARPRRYAGGTGWFWLKVLHSRSRFGENPSPVGENLCPGDEPYSQISSHLPRDARLTAPRR